MDIDSQSISNSDDVLFSDGFRIVVESFLPTLRASNATKTIAVDPNDAYVYEGDFYGYLNSQSVQTGYHWLVMRLNNILSPFDFNSSVTELMIPDETAIMKIVSIYNSSVKS
jgi:hypothetical protein